MSSSSKEEQVQVTDQFDTHAAANLIASDVGHGYGRALYVSQCPFTGASIYPGEAIREVTITRRDGRQRTGYTANRILAALEFAIVGEFSLSSWSLPGSQWGARKGEIVDQIDQLTSVKIMGHDLQVKEYRRNNTNEKWHATGWSVLSSKQVAAALKRRKNVAAYFTA